MLNDRPDRHCDAARAVASRRARSHRRSVTTLSRKRSRVAEGSPWHFACRGGTASGLTNSRQPRHRGQQRAGVRGVCGRQQDRAVGPAPRCGRRCITATSVGDVLDDADVVRDEQVGQAELALQLAQQVQDLRLHRDVERRGRLVADDQLRLRPPARGRSRCAGAGRRRTRADSARSASRRRPTWSTSVSRRGAARRGVELGPQRDQPFLEDRRTRACAGSARRTGPGR